MGPTLRGPIRIGHSERIETKDESPCEIEWAPKFKRNEAVVDSSGMELVNLQQYREERKTKGGATSLGIVVGFDNQGEIASYTTEHECKP